MKCLKHGLSDLDNYSLDSETETGGTRRSNTFFLPLGFQSLAKEIGVEINNNTCDVKHQNCVQQIGFHKLESFEIFKEKRKHIFD